MKFKQAGKLKDYIEFEYVLVVDKASTSNITIDESKIQNNHELGRIIGESEYKDMICMVEPYAVRTVSHPRMEKDVWLLPKDAIVGVVTLEENDRVVSMDEYTKNIEDERVNLMTGGINAINATKAKYKSGLILL